MTESRVKRVAVIGAGASGLPAIRWCREYGFTVVCYEQTEDIGGLWRYRQQGKDGEASVMKSTVINSSKEMTAYSDFPPPAHFANFMHNRQMLEYLRMYADRHNLCDHIHFGTEVLNVERAPNFEQTPAWMVTTKDKTGNIKTESYDGVLLASGHHAVPHWPQQFPNQQQFKGRFIHSHYYKEPQAFEGKRVVVVGVGNSGGDIAVELSRTAQQVYLVTRRGAWVMNRVSHNGWPMDVVHFSRFAVRGILKWFPTFSLWWWYRDLSHRFDHALYGIKPKHGLMQAHLTMNDELPYRMASGTIVARPNIAQFRDDGTSIEFEDGSLAENIDAVVFATGFSFDFPYLEDGKLIEVDENRVSLYKYMFKPDLSHAHTLCVLGLIQPFGSILPISEMQARVFCDMLSGDHKLPSVVAMQADIQLKKGEMEKRYIASRRHTIQVDYHNYMDELAELIDASPHPLSYVFTDPLLAMELVFGPMVPYQWRLTGAKKWSGAREAIMTVQERVIGGFGVKNTKSVRSRPVRITYEIAVFVLALFGCVCGWLLVSYMWFWPADC